MAKTKCIFGAKKAEEFAGVLLYKVYNTTMTGAGSSKLRKPDYVKALEVELQRNVGKYDEYLLLLGMGTNDYAIVNEASNMAAAL